MIYDKYLAKLWLNSKVVDRNQVTFVQDEKCQKKKKKKNPNKTTTQMVERYQEV